ncbi:MAG: 3-hydroxyacyl-ACP dehydratase FabZ family protein, partial [Bacillota bacterium]
MPPKFLFDISEIDLNHVMFGPEVIRQYNPQRGDMEHLDGVIYIDTTKDRLIAYKDVRDNEFWVAGHIPGRPLLPGVLMIEAAAQAASFYMRKYVSWTG